MITKAKAKALVEKALEELRKEQAEDAAIRLSELGKDNELNQLRAEVATLRKENEDLKQVTEQLRICGEGDGEHFKEMLGNARKSPVYWTEYCEMQQEEIKLLLKEVATLKLRLCESEAKVERLKVALKLYLPLPEHGGTWCSDCNRITALHKLLHEPPSTALAEMLGPVREFLDNCMSNAFGSYDPEKLKKAIAHIDSILNKPTARSFESPPPE